MKVQLEFERSYLGHNAAVYDLLDGPREGMFISAGGEGWITQWSLGDEDGHLLAKAGSPVLSLEWLMEGTRMLAGTMDGKLHFIDLLDQDLTRVFDLGGKASVFDIVKRNDEIWVADGLGRLTNWAPEGELKAVFQLSGKPLRKIFFRSDSLLLAAGSEGKVFEFDVETNAQIRDWFAHDPSVFAMGAFTGENSLWTGGRDALIKEWDLTPELAVCTREVNAHWFTVNDIAFHPSARIFATASRDKRLRLWDGKADILQSIDPGTPNGYVNSINTLLWAGSGNYLISAGDDRSIRSWKLTR